MHGTLDDYVLLYNTLLVEGPVLSGLGIRVAGAAAIENAANVSAVMSLLGRRQKRGIVIVRAVSGLIPEKLMSLFVP
jgi:hypothetical protein